nr:hypothetical protein Iba_chr12bCG5410 [Ipomoea batatas]
MMARLALHRASDPASTATNGNLRRRQASPTTPGTANAMSVALSDKLKEACCCNLEVDFVVEHMNQQVGERAKSRAGPISHISHLMYWNFTTGLLFTSVTSLVLVNEASSVSLEITVSNKLPVPCRNLVSASSLRAYVIGAGSHGEGFEQQTGSRLMRIPVKAPPLTILLNFTKLWCL